MLIEPGVGDITEPVSGRHWDRATVAVQLRARQAYFHRCGVRPTEVVFLHYGNRLEFFVDLLAIWMLGGCVVPVDARLTAFEIENLARAARPRFAVGCEGLPAAVESVLRTAGVTLLESPRESDARSAVSEADGLARVALDHRALILFTSGTTGQPKGVVHTHRSLRARWTGLRQSLGIETFRRTLCLLPTHFGHGLICNCLFPWLSGQSLYILPPFRPETLLGLGAMLDEHEITFMSSVPPIWRLALKTARPPRRGSLQRVFCGSAPLSAVLWRGVQGWTGTADVQNAYGITETGSWTAGTTVPGFVPEDGLVGVPWGASISIQRSASTASLPSPEGRCEAGQSGYVWINTPALMQGYLERDDLTDAVVVHGWFCTGDIGVQDDRGLLYLRGREREEINKGGMKVYPGDVDAVAEEFADTVDVCTFGFDEPLQGEDVGIALVLRNDDDDTLRRLYALMSERLAQHQLPRRWYVLTEIPRTSRGKVNRAQVADACAQRQAVNLKAILAGGRTGEQGAV